MSLTSRKIKNIKFNANLESCFGRNEYVVSKTIEVTFNDKSKYYFDLNSDNSLQTKDNEETGHLESYKYPEDLLGYHEIKDLEKILEDNESQMDEFVGPLISRIDDIGGSISLELEEEDE